MTPRPNSLPGLLALLFLLTRASAQDSVPPSFNSVRRLTNGDVALELTLPAGALHRVEYSTDLVDWKGLVTIAGAAAVRKHTDTNPSADPVRFYRAVTVAETNAITGDHLATAGPDAVIHPVNHASLVLRWGDRFIYNDPVGGATPYKGIPRPDVILVSHSHGDHFDTSTLTAVRQAGTVIVAPAAVYASLSTVLKAVAVPLANGQETNLFDMRIEAIPAYNSNHPKGTGNGYVVTLGGRRIYFAGDTGNIAEMRALSGIDVAFVCMNVPFTMTVAEAVTAVQAFRPGVVYPYHFRNSDGSLANLTSFRSQVGSDLGIEVRARTWY